MTEKKSQSELIKEAVQDHYRSRVDGSGLSSGCCGTVKLDHIGAVNYSAEDLAHLPQHASQHSFGCGDPLAFAGVQAGQTVVDIGSGAGLDAMIAAKAVGPTGMVFGVDMTPEMIQRAEENVSQAGFTNIMFLLGDAEDIPLAAETADWVISNCVINLSADKAKVFQEIYRILKTGGQILISDMVAENLPPEVRDDITAWASCIAGAVSEEEYLTTVQSAGFMDVHVVDRVEHSLDIKQEVLAEVFPGVDESMVSQAKEHGTRVASIRLSAKKSKAS